MIERSAEAEIFTFHEQSDIESLPLLPDALSWEVVVCSEIHSRFEVGAKPIDLISRTWDGRRMRSRISEIRSRQRTPFAFTKIGLTISAAKPFHLQQRSTSTLRSLYRARWIPDPYFSIWESWTVDIRRRWWWETIVEASADTQWDILFDADESRQRQGAHTFSLEQHQKRNEQLKQVLTFPLLQWISIGWFRLSSIVTRAAVILSSGTVKEKEIKKSQDRLVSAFESKRRNQRILTLNERFLK